MVRRLRGTRALGARLARRSRGRRSFWTGWRGVETTGSTATAVVRRRWRRPWRGSARERNWGRMEVSRRVGARRGARPGHQGGERGRQGGVQLRGELRCRRRAPWLPAWQAKQLAGAVAGLGRPGGLAGGPVVAPGKFSLFFCFLFLFCRFVEFLKIPMSFQNSPNCLWSLVGIFPAWNILVWEYLSI